MMHAKINLVRTSYTVFEEEKTSTHPQGNAKIKRNAVRNTHMITIETAYPQVFVRVDSHAVRISNNALRLQVKKHSSVGCTAIPKRKRKQKTIY